MSESLVVVSKIKQFVKKNGDLNTSAAVMEVLTKIIEKECLKAIENAKRDNRKTVMDRDFLHAQGGQSIQSGQAGGHGHQQGHQSSHQSSIW